MLKLRYRILVAEICKALPTMPNGFTLQDLAEKIAPKIGLSSGGFRLKGARLVTKTRELLDQPEVIAGVRRAFEVAASFTAVDALKKHVAWIQGEVEHAGEKLPPSYQALKDYEALAMPKPPKNVNVKQETLVARISVRDAPPETAVLPIDVTPAKLPSASRDVPGDAYGKASEHREA